ncbi:fatty acyl-AMP ligase [Mycobacterium sp. SVM_VP21]|nr:fatty acyl-AMP ligase [Mycobacterium sp. SVM_VP21]
MGGHVVPTADTLVELLRQQAARCGEKTAFSYSYHGDGRDGCAVTFRELDARARAIGAGLQRLGAGAGSRVLVVCRPGLDGIAGVFGCWYAGAVAVPVAEQLSPRLAAVIADAGVGFAVASPQMPAAVRSAVDAIAGSAHGAPLVWCGPEESDADAWAAPVVDSDSVAVIAYPAGTTCSPKGVVCTHENVMANLDAVGAAGLGDDRDVVVSWLPTHSVWGLIGVVLTGIFLGASTVLMAPSAFMQNPMRWLEAVSRWRATATVAPDFAYRLVVQRSTAAQRAGLDLSSLSRAVLVGVEPARAATVQAFAEAFTPAGFVRQALTPVYGLAEATLLVSGGAESPGPLVCSVDRAGLGAGWVAPASPDDVGAVAVLGCGRARQPVVIVDPDTRLECGPDEVGEIWVAGPGVAQGYWGAPAQTDRIFEAFLADGGGGPFLRTGDRGFIHGGQLCVIGRCPDLVVLGGVHHYPNEIEATVQDCHAVLLSGRGAVFADDAEALVVVQEISCTVDGDELALLVSRIQSALVDQHGVRADSILLVPASVLPSSPDGQIRRVACRWQYLDGTLDPVAHWQAPGPAFGPPAANVVALAAAAAPARRRGVRP